MSSNTATLLVSCPDNKGLVAALAQLLDGHGTNILDSDQHTDEEVGKFFQRIRFDLETSRNRRRIINLEKAGATPSTPSTPSIPSETAGFEPRTAFSVGRTEEAVASTPSVNRPNENGDPEPSAVTSDGSDGSDGIARTHSGGNDLEVIEI